MSTLADERLTQYCYFCMTPLLDGQEICPNCSRSVHEQIDAQDHLPRCILRDQYFVGRRLGKGGFGMTYLGRDLNLDRLIAIKEYFPAGVVYRAANMSVNAHIDMPEEQEIFEHGKKRALAEAQTVAKMADLPHAPHQGLI